MTGWTVRCYNSAYHGLAARHEVFLAQAKKPDKKKGKGRKRRQLKVTALVDGL